MSRRLVFLACDLSRGAFPNERVFKVGVYDGGEYIGLTPLHYCYRTDGSRLSADEPEANASINGKLAARLVRNGNGRADVAIPDGEIISVPRDALSERSEAVNVPI